MKKDNIFDIQMFSEGAAEGGSDGAVESGLTGDFTQDFNKYVLGKESAPVSQNTAEDNASSGTDEAERDADEQGEGSADGSQSEDGQIAEEDSEKEFEELIKGKFKGAFQKRTQGIINERFRTAKETEGKLGAALDAVAPLFDRYGLSDGDIEGLSKAIKEDSGIFTKMAMEKGIGVEEYRDTFYADREAKQKAELEARASAVQKAQATREEWRRQESEIQKTYPSFKLEEAFKNEEFRKMAMGGSSLMSAYRASHFDEIAAGLVAAATKRAAKNTVDSMQSNVNRPAEGGMASAAGTVTKKDVSNLSEADIFDLINRVGRGEIITF